MTALLLKIVGYPHELCHYLMAKSLGVEATMYPTKTLIYDAQRWQSLLITIAPSLVGFLFNGGIIAFALMAQGLPPNEPLRLILASSFINFGWQTGCLYDFYDIVDDLCEG